MKKIILSALVITFSGSLFAQTKTIHFETGTFAEVKAKAKKEKKLIFMDVFTQWCEPCKKMDKDFFTNDTVADYYNSKYINYKMDATGGDGADFAEGLKIHIFPTILYLDGDGKIVHRFIGAPESDKEKKDFMYDVLTPEKTFGYYNDRYKSKKSDPQFMLNYLPIMERSGLKYDSIVKDYFLTQKDADLISETNWRAIKKYCRDENSREFNYVINNYNSFKKHYTAASVDTALELMLTEVIGEKYTSAENIPSEGDHFALQQKISTLDKELAEKELFVLNINYYKQIEKMDEMYALINKSGDKFYKEIDYNALAAMIADKSDDKKCLGIVSNWLTVEIVEETQIPNNSFFDMHSYEIYLNNAKMLYKLGNKKDAKENIQACIASYKKNGLKEEEYKEATELQEKINKL